ncbi:MAG TPA: hypothetical protein VJA18_00020, partial [Candidatus Nanoarchaeia archaeon]|nr:hypothetical protein [Candidatus Nanoarchaeia archaeon]
QSAGIRKHKMKQRLHLCTNEVVASLCASLFKPRSLERGETLSRTFMTKIYKQVDYFHNMGLGTSRNITIRSMVVSFKPQVELLLNEIETMLEQKTISLEERAKIKKKLVRFSGAITVFMADLQTEGLSKDQEEKLLELQAKVRQVMDAVETKSKINLFIMVGDLRTKALEILK